MKTRGGTAKRNPRGYTVRAIVRSSVRGGTARVFYTHVALNHQAKGPPEAGTLFRWRRV